MVSPSPSPGCHQSPALAFLLSKISLKRCVFLAYFPHLPSPTQKKTMITMIPQHGRKGAFPVRTLPTIQLNRSGLRGLQAFLLTKEFKTSHRFSHAGQVCLDAPPSCTDSRLCWTDTLSYPSSFRVLSPFLLPSLLLMTLNEDRKGEEAAKMETKTMSPND